MALTLIVTNAGRAALINAPNTGTAAVTITHVGVSPTAVVPAKTATALPGEVKRITTFGGAATAADVINVTVSDESTDTYTVRSFALYLNDGTLFAIYGQPTPIIEKSSAAQLLLPIDVTLVDISATSIQFGGVGLVNPAATTETAGVVERATDAEALALADALRFLTPAQIGKIFTAANILSRLLTVDGAGSGLDADTVDGFQAAALAKLAGAAFTGPLSLSYDQPVFTFNGSAGGSSLTFQRAGNGTGQIYSDTGVMRLSSEEFWLAGVDRVTRIATINSAAASFSGVVAASTGMRVGSNIVWHAGNDGSGSGLDADLLDGLHAGAFAQLAGAVFTGAVGINAAADVKLEMRGSNSPAITAYNAANARLGFLEFKSGGTTLGSDAGTINLYTGNGTVLSAGSNGVAITGVLSASGAITQSGNQVWHVGNDGAGSGLDADLLDGRQASEFALVGASVAFGARVEAGTFYSSANQAFVAAATVPYFQFSNVGNTVRFGYMQHGGLGGAILFANDQAGGFNFTGGGVSVPSLASNGPITRAGNTVWDSGNDGSGSGLDADLLDGYQAADFAQLTGAAFTGNIDAQTPNNGSTGGVRIRANATSGWSYLQFVNAAGNAELGNIRVGAGGAFNISGALTRVGNTVWDAANDGSGSGLDADLLDGRHASEFALLSAFSGSFNANGYITLPGGLILQWATGAQMSSETSQAINWPVPFPNACFARFVSTDIAFASTVANSGYQTIDDTTAARRSTVTVYRQRYSESGGDSTASWPVVIGLGR